MWSIHRRSLSAWSLRAAFVTSAVLACSHTTFGQSVSPQTASIVGAVWDSVTALQFPVKAPVNTSEGWDGWYIGAQVGYGRQPMNSLLPDPGLDGGLHVGYRHVLPSRLFLGAEADVSVPDFFEDGVVRSVSTMQGDYLTEKIDVVSTLRGRLGYAGDRWLIYGTGGFAPSQARFRDSAALTNTVRVKSPGLRPGWALGAGAEFAVAPGWTARVEYLYDRLGPTGVIFPSGAGVQSTSDVQHRLRLGLSHTLSQPGTHAPSSGTTSSGTGSPAAVTEERWNIHGQDTYIEQGYFAFRSPYEGTNSLSGNSQLKDTESATAFLGVRLWKGAALYFNPEIDQGSGLDSTHGVSAFPNGEAQKSIFPMPRYVVDRLYLQQTVGLGGAQETITDGPNQLAGTQDISRITVVVGRLAVTDWFDGNTYANDPRTNFMNWNIYGAGAYDWTMDQISWTWGALAELNQKDWAFRAGYFLLPIVSSNNVFDTHIPDRGEYAVELEERYTLASQPGKLRVFGWVNHGTMGSYAAALALPETIPNDPDITRTRQVRTNPGIVINAEQAITDDLGLFSRVSYSPDLDEILGGTDCGESVTLGGVLKGRWWRRLNDVIGVSGVVGGLSPAARAYFAAGGMGILIGDGALNYRHEKGLEAYYAYALKRWATLSFDYQYIANPGYNADRGPVPIYAIRTHVAF
ncbi:MAG TPA: carbohydrate porin [Gemmatimonadaceae bacterium]|nr:carbohydrate porin [Gemmatimonadaceae bacterium]